MSPPSITSRPPRISPRLFAALHFVCISSSAIRKHIFEIYPLYIIHLHLSKYTWPSFPQTTWPLVTVPPPGALQRTPPRRSPAICWRRWKGKMPKELVGTRGAKQRGNLETTSCWHLKPMTSIDIHWLRGMNKKTKPPAINGKNHYFDWAMASIAFCMFTRPGSYAIARESPQQGQLLELGAALAPRDQLLRSPLHLSAAAGEVHRWFFGAGLHGLPRCRKKVAEFYGLWDINGVNK